MKFLVGLKRFCVGVLAIIGLLTLIIIIIMTGIITAARKPVPELVILELDLEKSLVEYVPDDPLAQVSLREATTVLDVVEALELARSDERQGDRSRSRPCLRSHL